MCIKRHLADSWNILGKAGNKTWTMSSAESEASTLIDSFWSFRYHESEKMISLISRSCCWTCSFPILTCTNAPGDRWPQLIFLRDWLWCVYNTPQLIFIICNICPSCPAARNTFFLNWSTVFENHRKSLIQHCERSELRLHFEWTKVNWKCQKWSILATLWKPEACGQAVLPDKSALIGQKLVENAKIQMRHFE